MGSILLWGIPDIVDYMDRHIEFYDDSVYVLGCWNEMLYKYILETLIQKKMINCHIIFNYVDYSKLSKVFRKENTARKLDIRANPRLNINALFTQRYAIFISGKLSKIREPSCCALVTQNEEIIKRLRKYFTDLHEISYKISFDGGKDE